MEFKEGDLVYKLEDNQYFIYKILTIDENETYHSLMYKPCIKLNTELETLVYHSPFDRNAFNEFRKLKNTKVKASELLGYHEYLKSTQSIDYIINIANNYYLSALQVTKENKLKEAIDLYTKAINLFPNFIEAIENRGFAKMDLGLFNDAIKDFKLSLSYNFDNFLSQFEIGECLYKLGEYEKAKKQFEIAQNLNPNEKIVEEFINKTNEKIKTNT